MQLMLAATAMLALLLVPVVFQLPSKNSSLPVLSCYGNAAVAVSPAAAATACDFYSPKFPSLLFQTELLTELLYGRQGQ